MTLTYIFHSGFVLWLAKGGTWSDETLSVWALGSTDSSVSWIVETEGKRIFYAGDLNNWYARFLPEAVPGETIYSEEEQSSIWHLDRHHAEDGAETEGHQGHRGLVIKGYLE